MTTIAVIAAGFSGTLLSLHLLRRCAPPTRIILIERNTQFGRGIAYSTGNANHLLNVPAGRMSAFHDQPGHFLNWLRNQPAEEGGGAAVTAGTFAPRQAFGAYDRALLNEEIRRSGRERLELIRGQALAIGRNTPRLTIRLDRDRCVESDYAVLATGNFPPEPMPVETPAFYDTPYYRPDPWAADALTGMNADDPVLLIGTGLTTVDAVVSLIGQGHTGPILALSRRGLPRRHAAVSRAAPATAPFPTMAMGLLRFLRSEAARARREGAGWQPVIDELRPFTADIWQAMSLADRRRFLRHLRPWWDVHRHRMAGPVADRIDAAITRGQLRILVGRVRSYKTGDQGVAAHYRPRGSSNLAGLHIKRVVNCSGPGADYDRIKEPLIRSMLLEGAARPDQLRLGLDVTASGALRNRDGAVSRRLFAIGPVTKGAFWEMTAVPDIRRQTEVLAEYLAGLVKSAPPPAIPGRQPEGETRCTATA